MPKVSVVIPAYNAATFIGGALDSVFAQTYGDYEVIVVDDGSADATYEAVARYGDRVNCVRQENQGPGAARNTGIRRAAGEYICFLDADDAWTPDSLERRVAFLDAHPEAMLVFSDYIVVSAERSGGAGRLRERDFLQAFRSAVLKAGGDEVVFDNKVFLPLFLTFSPHPIWTGTVMIRRTAIDAIGFFRTDVTVGEDRDYWLRSIGAFTLGYIHRPLAFYNHYQSTITKNVETYCTDRIKSLLTIPAELAVDRKIINANVGTTYYHLGYHYFKSGRYDEARRAFCRSLRYNFRQKESYKYLFLCLLPSRTLGLLRRLKAAV